MSSLSHHRALVRHWNNGVARVPGWPNFELTEPPYASPFTGPAWEDFPQGLQDDIEAYCERIGKRHKTASGRIFPPCKQSTIDMRRRELIAAVRAVVAAGIPLQDLRTLRELLRPDRVEILIEHYWDKNGEKPALYTIDLASKLLALARSEGLSEVEIERLDEIRIALEQYRSTGLTEKNRRVVRQIAQSDVWRDVVRLSRRLMAEARINAKTKPYRGAVGGCVKRVNLFEAIGAVSSELRHSTFLAWLFDPNGSHGFGDLIVKRLLQRVLIEGVLVRHSLPLSLICSTFPNWKCAENGQTSTYCF